MARSAKLLLSLSSIPAIWASCQPIYRDVVVVGGGGSGAHAAFRLQEDYNKSVIVIDKQSNLGGHVDTYYDASLDAYRDFGVQIYFPYMDALDFIGRFDNLTLVEGLAASGTTTTEYVDFSTGQQLLNYTGDSLEITGAVNFYNALVSNGYDNMTEPGFWNLPAAGEIPEDLLLPIGEFAAKYNATDALPLFWASVGGGVGSRGYFNDVMTLTALQSFPASYVKVYVGLITYYHIQDGNQQLYDAIAATLGDENILVNSTVTSSVRNDTGVTLTVSTPSGTCVVIAEKLLFAVPPTRENLAPFDLNEEETLLFSKPQYGRYHTALVSHSALTDGVVYSNTPTSAEEDPALPFLEAPFIHEFSSYGTDTPIFSIGTSGTNYTEFTEEAAVALAQQNLETMAAAGVLPSLDGEQIQVIEWSDHGPGGYGVTADELQAGWMADFYALQGNRSTWFTGNAIAADFSTMLWKFNDDLLERMLASW
ncbi:hypothetical protein BX600DRAFT_468988 [Xylariales sp. PMI_506]|nr:hypothetical protein BX600DRAFT_468988 [Xylariales sp. PMI_506]